ncbi:unnamed protein product [Lampetra fluviatilis]
MPPQHPQGKMNHQPVRRLMAPRRRKATKAGTPHLKGEQQNLHYQRAATHSRWGPAIANGKRGSAKSQFDELEDS